MNPLIGKRFDFEGITFEVKKADEINIFASKVEDGKARPGRPRKFKFADVNDLFKDAPFEVPVKNEVVENIDVFDEILNEATVTGNSAITAFNSYSDTKNIVSKDDISW